MNIYISIAMSVIILIIVAGGAIGIAMAAKRNHSGAEPSGISYGSDINQQFQEVKKITVTMTQYSPNMPAINNTCDKATGGGAGTADGGVFKVVNGRLRWTKSDKVEDYVFAEPQTDNIIPWNQIDTLAIVVPGFNNNIPIHVRDHYGAGVHSNQNYLDLFVPCSEFTNATKKIEVIIVDVTKPVGSISSTAAGGNGSIVIDPGHSTGSSEGANNWDIANRVVKILNNKGKKAVLTRTDPANDMPRPQRVSFANGAGASYFLSIHSNSDGGPGALGLVECHHSGVTDNNGKVEYASDSSCPPSPLLQKSIKLSHNVTNKVANTFDLSPVRFWGGDLGVLDGLTMPGAIVEMYAHDQASDVAKVKGKEDLMAQAIVDGIIQTINGQ